MVRLKEGDYVLDNRKREVAPWSEYATKHGYTFLSRQSYLDPTVWVSLRPKK
jgi:predicted transglutaminase-like cysteine proteinase